ncbi:hypothetical protein PT974_07646 [Cladobotryum mycophilum]|uniref:Hydrophobin n=1 Tax=Cladobotryum mycophilum TaxID=491253 RepID=A0ABR0SQ25_9HYPO
MKYTAALSVLALAATAAAVPTEIVARTGGGGGGSGGSGGVCNNNSQQVCCNGLLTCLIQVLGSNCDSHSYCCSTGAPVGSLINIALLNCVAL